MIAVVKIGPVSAPGMVSAAIGHDADMIGFTFDPRDPAALTPDKAATLVVAVPSGIDRVGIFADADDDTIAAVLRRAPLDLLQFEGAETPARLRQIADRFGLPLIRTISTAGQAGPFEPVIDWLALPPEGLSPGFRTRRPWMLKASLEPSQVAQAVRDSAAAALDLRLPPGTDAAAAAGTIRTLIAAARPAME